MSKAELEDFHITGRVKLSESTISCNTANKATLSNPEDRFADEETVKCRLALPDELVAKVLGYLPLRDRFRLETVCRQWQRCMYLEVEDLNIHCRSEVDQKYTLRIIKVGKLTLQRTKELPAVLHKLRISKVSHLRCEIDEASSDRGLLVLLADIASQATKVVVCYGIRFHPRNLVTFCDIIGPHVTTFQLTLDEWRGLPKDIQVFANSLARMKRLKEVSSNWMDLILACLNSFTINSLPHFQDFKPYFSYISDWKLWEHFKSIYGTQLKKITFRNDDLFDDEGELLLPWKDMAPFANLEYLDFMFRPCDCTLTALAEDLVAISRSCPLVRSLGLRGKDYLDEGFVVSLMEVRKLFVAIGKIKMLEKLDLFLSCHIEDWEGISLEQNLDLFALLENKSNISHLEADVRLFQISSKNKRIQGGIYGAFNNALLNLRHLNIFCTVSELDHFVGLERMQTISLYFHLEEAPESVQDSLIRILKASPALRSIKFCLGVADVSEALIRAIIEVAELQMEKHIDFFAKIGVYNKYQEAWEVMKHLAPKNLTLNLDDR